MLAVAHREAVDAGHSEGLDVALEHVFDRQYLGELGPLLAPVTVLELSHDDPHDVVEHVRVRHLVEDAVDVPSRGMNVFEEEDLSGQVYLPRGSDRLAEEPEASPGKLGGDTSAAQ